MWLMICSVEAPGRLAWLPLLKFDPGLFLSNSDV
jgi:hypothetical protein